MGLALIFGLWTVPAALALIVFLVPATALYHNLFMFQGKERDPHLYLTLVNITLAGGLLLVIAERALTVSSAFRHIDDQVQSLEVCIAGEQIGIGVDCRRIYDRVGCREPMQPLKARLHDTAICSVQR